jgi:uncharacterized membrane protein YkoI
MDMRWILAGAVGLALVAAGVGVGIATGGPNDSQAPAVEGVETGPDDADQPGEAEGPNSDETLTGTDAEKAAAAALAWAEATYKLEGQVTEVEQGDDGAAYGVEVLLADGRQVEVHFDAAFNVTGDEVDED